jgi:hypothetical protein
VGRGNAKSLILFLPQRGKHRGKSPICPILGWFLSLRENQVGQGPGQTRWGRPPNGRRETSARPLFQSQLSSEIYNLPIEGNNLNEHYMNGILTTRSKKWGERKWKHVGERDL